MMKIFVEQAVRALFFKALLCALVLPALAAGLVCLYPKSAPAVLFAACLALAACLSALFIRYLQEQEQRLEDATAQIEAYIFDRRQGGLDCQAEGALYRLFHKVNTLLTIANAHADSERRAKEFLRDTISDISHQLKTPIAALNIYNGILQQEGAGHPTLLRFIGLSEQELDRMEALVQGLLKMARLDAGVITLEQKPQNLSALLQEVRQAYAFRAEQEKKTIQLQGDEPSVLVCDRTWLTEALGNLVKNALDHTGEGGLIQICWRQSPCLTQITIRDNGSGIHPEDLYHIFKRFYRSRFSKDTQGIGLGLPLAKAIIEAHRGSIEVNSRPGHGSEFIIHLLTPTNL